MAWRHRSKKREAVAERIGYPVLVRPSYVLGGRAMAIVYDEESLDDYVRNAVGFTPDRPVLIDKFLEQAAEFDVDALADESACVIAGIQEHIEEAGIHSGDSSCVLPPVRIDPEHLETMRHYTRKLAKALVGTRADEHSVRDQGPSSLCARSKSACFAHSSVCFESDGSSDRADRRAGDGRTKLWQSLLCRKS